MNEQNWGAATGAYSVMGEGHNSCGKCLLSETKQLLGTEIPPITSVLQ